MVEFVENNDEQFLAKLTLIKCGSFFNLTKITRPNEIDFSLAIAMSEEKVLGKCMHDARLVTVEWLIDLCEKGLASVDFSSENLIGWGHGVYNKPSYSGYRYNMFQFIYTDPAGVECDLTW